MTQAFYDIDVDSADLIEFADKYQNLGNAVQEQFKDLLDNSFEDINPNAVDLIRREFSGWHEDFDEALDEYHDWLLSVGEDEDEDEELANP